MGEPNYEDLAFAPIMTDEMLAEKFNGDITADVSIMFNLEKIDVWVIYALQTKTLTITSGPTKTQVATFGKYTPKQVARILEALLA